MSCNSLTEIKQKGCFEECTDNDAEQSRTAFIIFRYTPPTRREEVMLPHICIAENHKAQLCDCHGAPYWGAACARAALGKVILCVWPMSMSFLHPQIASQGIFGCLCAFLSLFGQLTLHRIILCCFENKRPQKFAQTVVLQCSISER